MCAKQCLVVDDDAANRMHTVAMAKRLGLEVEEAEDGQEALEICHDHLPDIVLLDLYMPRMDGPEFMEKMRQIEGRYRLSHHGGKHPVVFLHSADSEPTLAAASIQVHADGYLPKPLDGSVLRSKLQQAGVL